ncbi:MAG: 1-acyl-sn-glycerol-3-phosphate acyltransferase [Gemmatimonadaceae bacterium]|nr:1-acyl-sn-glycerol-3-phosphate acyltransferase [Gemmatimonadaceae bacterium]
MLRTAYTTLVLFVGTLVFGSLVLLAQLVGLARGPGSVYERAQIQWGRWLLRAAGVKVVRHGGDDLPVGAPHVFVANHISWFDIPVTLDALPPYGFVAKRELESVPLFGAAARAAGVIYIDRENLKAAFTAYEDAASKIRAGQSVLVYPEGTRGERYALRPFKKGPFVLAIGAGVPVVPVVIHGTIAVNPRGEYRASPGVVHVHLLDPIPTEGLTYDDRQALAEKVRFRMADVLRTVYGVEPALESRLTARAVIPTPELTT